jgi:uncharacterized protein (TIGR00375 family)
MRDYYVDLHIHIGRTERGEPVKISASRSLTFYNIAHEASERKGIDVIGIIDCHSPNVQRDIDHYLDHGQMEELADGGIRFRNTTVLLGCELEVKDPGMGPAHLLAFLPTFAAMKSFTGWAGAYMTNISLSSQRIYVPARMVQEEVYARGGFIIPAHIFTPHKSVYGSAAARMEHLLDLELVAAVELGLSADTAMAGMLSELDRYTFVTNSDAHSLGKIGREYNRMRLGAPNFKEVAQALEQADGRKVTANYGLHPRLGKYHRTYCKECQKIMESADGQTERCPGCGSTHIVPGVLDRIRKIADREAALPSADRPPYYYQIPLEFVPGLGPRTLNRLLDRFGTEMNIIHRVAFADLAEAAGEGTARYIVAAREGLLQLDTGGGGIYGKVARPSEPGQFGRS